jgi:hypothetical protein
MSTSPHLDRLVRIGQLKAESAARAEIEGLIASGGDRLQDAQTETLTLSGRFDLAYNSAHALSLAALRSHGYRSEHRYIVFQCLEHTLNLPPEMCAYSTRRIASAMSPSTKACWTSTVRWLMRSFEWQRKSKRG